MTYNKLSNYATTINQEDGFYRVTYHSTCIVKWNDEKIILDSGGYQTSTTKKKMNQASNQFNLDFQVYQKDGNWFVNIPNGYTLDFTDKMEIKRTYNQFE